MRKANLVFLIMILLAIYMLEGCGSTLSCTPDPDTNRIVYVSGSSSQWGSKDDIYMMNADGKCVTRLTHTGRSERRLVTSPDSAQILFEGLNQFPGVFSWNLYALNLGDLQTDLVARQGRNVAWSPDGAQVAFLSNRDGYFAIYIMQADGSNQERLTDIEVGDEIPSWSPDGQRIAFRSEGEGSDIYVMNVDGSSILNLTKSPDENEVQPMWSPDGQYILFVMRANSRAADRDEKVCAVDVYEGDIRCILKASSCELWDWGPSDGDVSIKVGIERWLYMINVVCALEHELGEEGLPPKECYSWFSLPDWPHSVYPGEWSPDGTMLVFWTAEPDEQKCNEYGEACTDHEVYVVRADGTGLVNLTNNVMIFDGYPTWVR